MAQEVQEFEIFLLEGLGPLKFGMQREQLRSLFEHDVKSYQKTREALTSTDVFCGVIHVHYDKYNTVEFIEIGSSEHIKITLQGNDLLHTRAVDVLKLMESIATYDKNDLELGFSYVFPKIEFSLWRDSKEDKYFQAVGFGRKGYFSVK